MIIEDEKVPINVEVKNNLGMPLNVTMTIRREYIDKDVERKTEKTTARHSQKKISVELDPSCSNLPKSQE